MTSSTLFGITFFIYVVALIASIASLASKKESASKVSIALFSIGLLLHTVAMFVRWAEAGEVEVAALQHTENRILEGWEWFAVWISHPPWANLYESLICFAWGMSAVSLYGILRFRIVILPIFAISLSLIVMGAASLLIDQEITPLIPALQSKWIHLHVTMATISYPAFGLAAILSLFYLLKENVKTEHFGIVISLSAAAIILMVGGSELVLHADYFSTLIGDAMGRQFPITYSAQDIMGKSLTKNSLLQAALPYAGIPLLAAFVLFVISGITFFASNKFKNANIQKLTNLCIISGFAVFTIAIAVIIYQTSVQNDFVVSLQMARELVQSTYTNNIGQTLVGSQQIHGSGNFRFALSGNPFEFLLLLTAWLSLVFFFVLANKRDWLVSQLPSSDILDDLSYKTILFAFPFLTLLIITGAVWAYYAWGRYWGWDPKETWSLITWIVYSIYLHVRITHGWEGKAPAIISVIGFAVVIFTYLGVNILLSGLHSYGSG